MERLLLRKIGAAITAAIFRDHGRAHPAALGPARWGCGVTAGRSRRWSAGRGQSRPGQRFRIC